MHIKNTFCTLLAALLLLGSTACHKKYIENTQIRDTEDNRKILELLETYRSALEEKDADKLLSLCSQHYYEDMATSDKHDDFTIAELKDKAIPKIFEHTDELYVSITVDALELKKDRGYVDFRYDYRAHLIFPAGAKWLNDTEFNRFELVKEDGRWLVLSGL